MVKKIFPKWMILFSDVTTNSERRSVFQKMPIIFQNNFKRVTKNCLLLWFNFQNAHFIIIKIYNGYLVFFLEKY